jgi:bla regulator protein blaR1
MLSLPCKLEAAAALSILGMTAALPVCTHSQPAVGQAASSAPASPAASGAGKLTFDAASVRPSTQQFAFKGVDFLNPVSDLAPPQGGLFSWNVQLPWLINFAYDLRSSQARREAREALPKWAQDGWLTVEARAEGSPSRDDVRQMVRSLLQDRFQFAAHMEKRETQVYAVVVAKPGLGLKPHLEGTPCMLSPLEMDEKKYPNLNPSYKAVPARCGVAARDLSHTEHRLEMLNVTMQQIAESLAMGLPLPVVDRTGLAGRYDAVLDFGPDDVPLNAQSSDEIGLAPMTDALQKQLGLKLVKQNAAIDILVIDHIEKLSEN